jgi:Rieske Fe-S protein
MYSGSLWGVCKLAGEKRVDRRDFIKLLGVSGLAGATVGISVPVVKYIMPSLPKAHSYPITRLVWSDGRPVRVDELEVNKKYVFFYPLKSTPCFLLNLGDSNGVPVSVKVQVYTTMTPLNEEPLVFKVKEGSVESTVPGYGRSYVVEGVGPNRSIVAYSAVCQHFGCPYPAVDFHPPGRSVPLAWSEVVARGGVIYCACHGGAYDPYRGAAVILAPPQRPLPFVRLEVRDGELWAVEVVGATVFGRFCNTCAEEEELVGSESVVREA